MSAAIALMVFSGATVKTPSRRVNAYVSNFENVLGTSLAIKVLAPSPKEGDKAEQAAIAEISRLDKILSAYDKQSEFSKWSSSIAKPIAVSPELYEVLSLFEQWKLKSNGALDASAEVVGRVWKNAAEKNQEPSALDLAQAVSMVKQPHYRLNKLNHTAERLDSSPLALNSFAKSYIINKATDAAMSVSGVTAVVVNIGGDLVVKGNLKENISVSDPKADAENDAPLTHLLISNKAVATSGNYRRGYKIGDKWYSHIVDPRTGKPVDNIISATVVAPNASDAGALATAFNVLTPMESARLASTVPGSEFLLITSNGEQIKSTGWKDLVEKEKPLSKIDASASAINMQDWANLELVINLELNLYNGGRAPRPFVAVWIEDSKGLPVRHISLWYNRSRYLPELYVWYRVYQLDDMAGGSSSTSATRSAGKYTLKWDGKSDIGAYVKGGKYNLFIETAREHGTHQLIKQELDFTKKPADITLQGNTEIASASLEYRKKAN